MMALLLISGVALPYVVGYHVDPVKAMWSGWALGDVNHGVSQSITFNFDSLCYVELFAGTKGNGGAYTAQVLEDGDPVMQSVGYQDFDCRWVKFDQWTDTVAFTKGKQLTIKFTRGGGDSLQYYYSGNDPYKYGAMPNDIDPNPYDLCMRVYGLLRPTDSSYFGVDDCNFVPWYGPDSTNRTRLRDAAADSARDAGIGSMMVYAVWPKLLGDNDTTLSWSEFDAHLWEVETAHACPVVNIQQVAKYASSRQAWIYRPDGEGSLSYHLEWDTSVFCAPKNLFAPIEDDTNYWARYIEELVTHDESEQWRRPWEHPCSFVHTWEIWNEPNDTCTYSLRYLSGTTGWWRRPNLQYTSGYGGLTGLCELYTRMAYVAASVIRDQPGHEHDTILIGSTHQVFAEDDTVLAMGKKFVRECYEIAEDEYGGAFWDGISFHPYQGGYGFRPGFFEESAESLRTVARQRGDDDVQVWCTEVGILYSGLTDTAYYQSDAMQYLPQLYTTALASQALPGARYDRCQWFFYSSINMWWPIPYGLIGLWTLANRNDTIWPQSSYWEKFSSYYTYQGLVSQLAERRVEQRILAGDSAADTLFRLYQFEEPDGRKKWVGWAVDTIGRGSESCEVRIPVRTDEVAVQGGQNVNADADGWLRRTLHPSSQCLSEVGIPTRPDLVVESLTVSPDVPHVHSWMDVRAYVKNVGRTTPESTLVRFFCNDSQFASYWIPEEIDSGQTAQAVLVFYDVPQWMHGQSLFRAEVNPGQEFVEKNGMDDNAGYARRYISYGPGGDLIGELYGSRTNEPLPLLRLESHSYEADTLGSVPCESARLVQWAYGNDTVVHGGDTTAWFSVNEAVSLDTSWLYLSGQGKYQMFLQVKDSWSMSDLIPDTSHPFVVFDTTGATGSIVINSGARFATSSTCTLRLAAQDSGSGVAEMRFMNVPKVNLVTNGSFTATAGSWSYAGSGSGYDTSLGMAKLATGGATCVRQFIPAESISAYAGDSCVLQASVMALMHGGNALGDISYWHYYVRTDTSLHDTSWTLVDSATFQDSLAFWGQSPGGGNSLTRRFLLTTPTAESGWVWRGGMVRVQAVGINGAVGTVWADNIALNGFQPDTGYAWWRDYDTLASWNIGSGAGQHIVRALYLDSAGNEKATPAADTIILDPTAPVVHITLPSLGQMVNGTVEITGWAYDPVEVSGDTWFSARRLYYRHVDSTNWRPVLPDSCSHVPAYPDSQQILGPAVDLGYWNTLSVQNGQYYLKLVADDSAGNLSSCSTWVMVFHGGGGGNFCAGPPGSGTGMGEGSLFVGSSSGYVLHLSDDLDSLDCFQVTDSGSQAKVTALLEVGNDSLLVLDAANKRVHKLHRSGQHRRRLVSNLSQPMDLKRDANGNFWLVDKGWHRIGKFRSNGTLVFVRGGLGSDSLHFHSPEGIAVKGNLVYVADGGNNRIAVWDTSGNFKTTITGDFENPTSVMVTDSGAIYLTDGIDGNLKGITPLGGNIATIVSPDSDKLRGLVASDNGHWLFTLAPQANKVYKLQIVSDENLPGGVQSSGGVLLPKTLSFAQPFPNPARTRLNIAYALPRATRVSVRLYDAAGKLVNTLASGDKKPGYYSLTWNRQDAKGRSCACGVYFCTLSADDQLFSRKVVLTE
jgi:hypothetical protein